MTNISLPLLTLEERNGTCSVLRGLFHGSGPRPLAWEAIPHSVANPCTTIIILPLLYVLPITWKHLPQLYITSPTTSLRSKQISHA